MSILTRILPIYCHLTSHILIHHINIKELHPFSFFGVLMILQLLDLNVYERHRNICEHLFLISFDFVFAPPRRLQFPLNCQQPQTILVYTGTIWSDRISLIRSVSPVPRGKGRRMAGWWEDVSLIFLRDFIMTQPDPVTMKYSTPCGFTSCLPYGQFSGQGQYVNYGT